ncbi:MAG TPA: helix-turn-helix domain-containing protein [Acidimicrobiales bacterium]|nr:helix-turn-helix domain-containing protein [Acidimicrobiales bacterium]
MSAGSRAEIMAQRVPAELAANPALGAALARVGDRWTLLLVDALLEGPRRFKDLEEAVPGLAPNVLSARLRRLVRDGLVLAVPYSARPPRHEYRVSEEGRQLAGALRLLARWGALASGAPGIVGASGQAAEGPWHRSCGTPLEARWYCPTCGRITEQADDDVQWL